MANLRVFMLLPAFMALWCSIVFVISFISEWNKLARRFRAQSKPSGHMFGMQRAIINGANYNNCLTFGATNDGLYLSIFPLFAIGHAPLLIPWTALSDFQKGKFSGFPATRCEFFSPLTKA